MPFVRTLLATSIFFAAFARTARAESDPICSDEFSYAFRRDIQVEAISYVDLPSRFQEGYVVVKNWGAIAMPGERGRYGRVIDLKIDGHPAQGRMEEGLPPFETTVIRVTMNPNVLKPCAVVGVRLDTKNRAGQWGCAVFANDFREIAVTTPGISCR